MRTGKKVCKIPVQFVSFPVKNQGVIRFVYRFSIIWINDFYQKNPDAHIYYFTTKGRARHVDVTYEGDVYLMFGPESRGLPEELLIDHPADCVRIPMLPTLRSLNLSNSVAIAAYEVLRQWEFEGFQTEGQLHEHRWEE